MSSRGRVQIRARNLAPPRPGTSEGLQSIMDSMVVNEVSLFCKTDSLILKFDEKLHAKLDHEAHQKYHISTIMRELGRLLQHIRKRSPEANLADFLTTEKFSDITESVRQIASYESVGNKYGVPSLALKVGQSQVKWNLT